MKDSLSETPKFKHVTVRMASKLQYGIDLLARKQRRNTSQIVIMAIENLIYSKDGLEENGSNLLDELWDLNPEIRFKKLSSKKPNWLTYDEEIKIKNEVNE